MIYFLFKKHGGGGGGLGDLNQIKQSCVADFYFLHTPCSDLENGAIEWRVLKKKFDPMSE